jgi:DNA-binding transcriptional ArsR family regulator
MADLLDTVRRDINARLDELRPLVQEAASLEAALNALNGAGATETASPARMRRRRPRAATAGARDGRRPALSREALIEHVRAHPGSTAGDVAKALGVNRNSVSTRLAQLAKAGALTKAKRGYAAP